ncbi:MAG: hypothetical protein JST01_06660 [Cyanobacteria bacterium SZAS TMP-1]|nr:hypothetical protein [Cyanobacteria bacterium SZAS TMP-1]
MANVLNLRLSNIPAALLLACLLAPTAVAKSVSESNLPPVGDQQLKKSLSYMRSGNWQRGTEATEMAVAGAPDVKACLYALSQLDKFGAQANKARRACLAKALNLATTHEELEEVAFKARQAGCFDLSKEALDSLVGSTTSIPQLTELAMKAQRSALPDVAHIAMEKAYKLVNNEPDALDFVKQCHDMGLDDLSRQALRDLVDDQASVADMVKFLPTLEQYKMMDMVRYVLKVGLDKAKDTDEMLLVYDNAKKYEQADIVKVAQFRGRKMVLLKKVKTEEATRADAEAKKAENDPTKALQRPTGF